MTVFGRGIHSVFDIAPRHSRSRDHTKERSLDPDSTTSENALETLVTDKLLALRDAFLAAPAVLAALAGLCRSNALSVLPEA